MKQMWKKDDPDHVGDSWYSHKEGDNWCNGKEKKAYQPNQALLGTAVAQIQAQLNRMEKKIDSLMPGTDGYPKRDYVE